MATTAPPRRGLAGYLPELALLAVTTAYGSTFVLVQDALDDLTPAGFIVVRFAFGSLALAPFALARLTRRPTAHATTHPLAGAAARAAGRPALVAGAILGALAFGGYLFQNVGLQHTTTSNSAFITGLFAVFVPVITTVVHRRVPPPGVLVAIAVSTFGVFLLTGADPTLGYGEAMTLGCAVLFAGWIVYAGGVADRVDLVVATFVQLVAITLCALPAVAIGGFGELTARALFAGAFTGVVCSALAFALQLWAQRRVDPERTGIIGLFEPVVAGFVGFLVGERLGVVGTVGAVVILAGIALAEWSARRLADGVDRSVQPVETGPTSRSAASEGRARGEGT